MKEQEFAAIVELLKSKHEATARLLALKEAGPTVFLIDENHSMADLIRDNIQIATTLVSNARVRLIAVEGIEGDGITRRDLMSPDPDRCFGVAHFAKAFVSLTAVEVVGVDSLQLFKAILSDCEAGRHTPASHPLEEQRSLHMLDATLAKLRARPSVSAAIVNGGSRHIEDIEKIVRVRQAAEGGEIDATVIRVRSNLHPTT